MQYLTLEQYKNYGGELSQLDFIRFCYMASRKVDEYTLNRVANDKKIGIEVTYNEPLSMLMLELIKIEADKMSNVSTGKILSESNQGMSLSYKDVDSTQLEKKGYELTVNYLSKYTDSKGVSLTYLGVS